MFSNYFTAKYCFRWRNKWLSDGAISSEYLRCGICPRSVSPIFVEFLLLSKTSISRMALANNSEADWRRWEPWWSCLAGGARKTACPSHPISSRVESCGNADRWHFFAGIQMAQRVIFSWGIHHSFTATRSLKNSLRCSGEKANDRSFDTVLPV